MQTDLIGERVRAERGAKGSTRTIVGTVRAVSFQGFRVAGPETDATDLVFALVVEAEPEQHLCVVLAHECTVIEARRGEGQ